MKVIPLVLVSIILAWSVLAQDDEVTLSYVTSQGKSVIHKITDGEAERLPEWNPESGKPAPLTLDAAIKKGKEWLKQKNPKIDDFFVRDITLERVGFDSAPNRWFYKIEFDAVVGGQHLYGGQFLSVVLMNGKVIEPIIRKAQDY